MVIPDVNVLVYAFRGELAAHEPMRRWLAAHSAGAAPLGLSELVASGFVRVVTHPKVFRRPTPVDAALGFIEALAAQPATTRVRPGPRHWAIFQSLCRAVGARGNLVPDAYLAAQAVELGAEWISTDRDFARFPGLRWSSPLDT